jgi:hypothetical protein
LDRSERAVLAALAADAAPLLSERTLDHFALAKTTAREARARLSERGIVQRITIADPLLADFATHRIPASKGESGRQGANAGSVGTTHGFTRPARHRTPLHAPRRSSPT